ncbi:hypothetical protein PGC35_06660 [Psychrobacillus sp. PGGUH221]|uniref:aspartate/glutamate racemase family protein n=1 Tax=Psychrobacillus sp. PGGUH221 TaxID=3020058 RepID=UPI0035C71959
MKLACLHAHHSNIEYIESALVSYEIELVHFVDPGLVNRVTHDTSFCISDAQQKVKEQIEWISKSNVDAILITCTNYVALLNEADHLLSIPIIKIDEPFFEVIASIDEPQVILFTNPATVEGTLDRLNNYLSDRHKNIEMDVVIIEDSFELLMQGLSEKYYEAISKCIHKLLEAENKIISVAQLSMVNASIQVEKETSITIINPLHTLIDSLAIQLNLKHK